MVLLILFTGCETPNTSSRLSVENRYFILESPFLIEAEASILRGKESVLPSGRYQCYFSDYEGFYYEAPASSRPQNPFKTVDGGVFITRTEPARAYLYVHNNQTTYTYMPNIGMFPIAGNGKYIRTSPLPDTFFEHVEFENPNP